MAETDLLLRTIEAIHAAGLEEDLWPQALAAITRTVGGIAATLETFDRRTVSLTDFHSFGLPPVNEVAYVEEYAAHNPRIPRLINAKPGDVMFDYMVLDEQAMDRNAFYSEFLAPSGYRYCVGGTLAVSKRESALFSVQRLAKQGHVGRGEIEQMHRLMPHVRQAFDLVRRLKKAGEAKRSLEYALDWLADGAGLVRCDGRLLYVNSALQAIARQRDGLRISKDGTLEFSAAEARARFSEAIASARWLRDGQYRAGGATDFAVPRPSEAPSYLVAVRPLLRGGREREVDGRACAIVFVRDPTQPHLSTISLLREVFGFTAAEASLARALQDGVPAADYARRSRLSLHTVYTHLRRIREKTRSRRQAELFRKLNDVRLPPRAE